MTSTSLATFPLDLRNPELIQDPYPYYKVLREQKPISWDETNNWWILSRYDDVLFAQRDPRLSTRIEPLLHQILNNVPARLHCPVSALLDRAQGSKGSWLSGKNPPVHTHMRRLANATFAPQRLQALKPFIESLCNELIERAFEARRFDIIPDYAFPLPFAVIVRVIGLPEEDGHLFKKWCAQMLAMTSITASAEDRTNGDRAVEEFTSYVIPLVRKRRKDSRDDLLSDMTKESDGFRLNDRQIAANAVFFTSGGFETTEGLLGNGMLALLRNVDQLALLGEHPELIESAVEELLRYDSPVQFQLKTVSEDLELDSHKLRRGDRVLTLRGSANRDPEVFENPDILDIRRKNNKHLSFGSGIHYCIGANLARLEAHIAINTVLRRMPQLRLETENIKYKPYLKPRTLQSLPVAF